MSVWSANPVMARCRRSPGLRADDVSGSRWCGQRSWLLGRDQMSEALVERSSHATARGSPGVRSPPPASVGAPRRSPSVRATRSGSASAPSPSSNGCVIQQRHLAKHVAGAKGCQRGRHALVGAGDVGDLDVAGEDQVEGRGRVTLAHDHGPRLKLLSSSPDHALAVVAVERGEQRAGSQRFFERHRGLPGPSPPVALRLAGDRLPDGSPASEGSRHSCPTRSTRRRGPGARRAIATSRSRLSRRQAAYSSTSSGISMFRLTFRVTAPFERRLDAVTMCATGRRGGPGDRWRLDDQSRVGTSWPASFPGWSGGWNVCGERWEARSNSSPFHRRREAAPLGRARN